MNSISLFVLTFFVAVIASAAPVLSPKDYTGFPNTLKGRHFVVIKDDRHSKLESGKTTDCRANISRRVCLVEPTTEGQRPQDRECLAGSQGYAIYFEQVYDTVPASLQKMFCSLKRINIEKKFFGTAYASTIEDEAGKPIGAVIGIRKSVLDENLNLTNWATWKEQLSFGGITDSYTLTPHLPHVVTQSSSHVSDFLYMLIAHEFGHIFDFANELNRGVNCQQDIDSDFSDCEFAEGTWGSISWERFYTPHAKNDFVNRRGLCFYGCERGTMNVDHITSVYAGLAQSDYISTYAATNPWDDFAESIAYYLMEQNIGTTYVIDTKQGTHYDMMWKLKSPQFSKKYEYIQKFLDRTDIIYP